MSVENRSPHSHNAFRTTQWTRVLQARGDSDEARAAISDLCEAYYAPVFTFIRAQLRNEEQSRDLTQEFFARLLKKSGFSKLDPARGRFRSYLLAAVKHFLSDMRDRDAAVTRNPGRPLESLQRDTTSNQTEIQIPDPNAISPDVEFDRKWAMTLLDRALNMNESTLKVSIHRLRRRFRDAVKTQIAATLPEPDLALVTDEMSYLVSILR